jgi:molybdopterin molybdotransferase
MQKPVTRSNSLPELLSVQEAQELILAAFRPLPGVSVELPHAVNRILAEDIRSTTDLPPFANASMDGFAVIASDLENTPVKLEIIADIPAGVFPEVSIQHGKAARVMTGAPIPDGSNAVVPIEDTDLYQSQVPNPLPDSVIVMRPVQPGEYIRPRGQDLHKDTVVLKKGRRLQPQDIGLAASLGIYRIPVYAKPSIALLVTGDELVHPNEPLAPGKIRDANSYILGSLIERAGGVVVSLGVAPDDPAAIRERLESAKSQQVDLILTSAGVSVGAFDFVRSVVLENGALTFWKVNMRPGKPLAFGSYRGIPLVGLPGNPVSAYVGFLIFILPALRKMTGVVEVNLTHKKVFLAEKVESDGRESYLRAILIHRDNRLEAVLSGHQGSGNIYSLVQANALLILPSGVKSLPVGSEVNCLLLDDEIGY